MKKKCKECGKDLEFQDLDENNIWYNSINRLSNIVCSECEKLTSETEKQKRICAFNHEREVAWRKICPPLYCETDISKLPFINAHKEVMKWVYNPKGLLLRGRTGTGKSRTAWMLAKREWSAGRKIECFGAKEFSRECVRVATESASYAKRWTNHMAAVDILFIDDFGKSDMSEFVKATIFELIENRCSNMKPLILTTNDTGETLGKRFSPEQGEPIVRRLREHCDCVVFAAKKI